MSTADELIEMFMSAPAGAGDTNEEGWMISFWEVARIRCNRLFLSYTGGESIVAMRNDLAEVIASFEEYAERYWAFKGDHSLPTFDFDSVEDYSLLMQLVGLCFLLHRRDLLPRLATLQDGENGANGGYDWLFEQFTSAAMGGDARYESEHLSVDQPYEALADASCADDPSDSLKEIDRFLKRWYKDLSATGWHDAHIPNKAGKQGGYYGYWSFEAGAAVLLLDIEDDASLHKYLYYPKEMVDWAREHADFQPDDGSSASAAVRQNVPAGQQCPEAGRWFTPAKPDSRRYFKQGETMPEVWSSQDSVDTELLAGCCGFKLLGADSR